MSPERASRGTVAAAAFLVTAVFASCDGGDTALARGDRLWADSSYDEALAEYRLAVRQSGEDEDALARVAHAYAAAGRVEDARDRYAALLERAPEYRDQALFDFLSLGERALSRGDQFELASAMEAALAVRSELPRPEFAAPLARYYAGTGNAARAAEFYRWGLAYADTETAPQLLYELGVLLADETQCAEALGYLHGFETQALAARRQARRERTTGGRDPWVSLLNEARWHIGNCSFRLAQVAQDSGQARQALDYLDTVVELGVPENVQDQASFLRGEVLFGLGRFDEALESYRRVLRLNPARTGRVVERAQRRIDQIRFEVLPGRPGQGAAGEGPAPPPGGRR